MMVEKRRAGDGEQWCLMYLPEQSGRGYSIHLSMPRYFNSRATYDMLPPGAESFPAQSLLFWYHGFALEGLGLDRLGTIWQSLMGDPWSWCREFLQELVLAMTWNPPQRQLCCIKHGQDLSVMPCCCIWHTGYRLAQWAWSTGSAWCQGEHTFSCLIRARLFPPPSLDGLALVDCLKLGLQDLFLGAPTFESQILPVEHIVDNSEVRRVGDVMCQVMSSFSPPHLGMLI